MTDCSCVQNVVCLVVCLLLIQEFVEGTVKTLCPPATQYYNSPGDGSFPASQLDDCYQPLRDLE